MTALEKVTDRRPVIRPQVGLMLSIGEPPESGRNYPRKLDHFRPKPGTENQYAAAVEKFQDAYGAEPRQLDIVLISNSIGDVLDIRLKAWGTSGLRAIGQTNYALAPDRMLAFDDELVTFPEKQPEPGLYRLKGPDDPIIERVGLKLYGVFRFALPKVTGLTTLAEISTTSKRSMLNLLAGLQQVQNLTGGHLAGIPFVLAVRPARTRYFDERERKRKTSTFYELVFEAPMAIDEFFEQVQLRRAQMNAAPARLELPPVRHDDADRDREIAPGLWRTPDEQSVVDTVGGLALSDSEDVRTREEPSTVERPSDALLNRIANLEEEVGDTRTLLYGGWGVESAAELDAAHAEAYERALQRLADERAEPAEGEIVPDDDDPFAGLGEEPAPLFEAPPGVQEQLGRREP